MDFGENLTETAVRECREETGYHIQISGLVGVFTDPGHVIHYTSNDEIRQEFSVVYHGHPISGQPVANDEATEIVWIPISDVPGLEPMHPSMRLRLNTYLAGQTPHIDRIN